jgi:shikimate dehydrogenase
MISAKTKVVGLFGWPVGHSMSPAIHNAAFAATGLDYVYVAMPVHPNDLFQAMQGVKALSFAGVNITVPHKINILPCLDALDRSAELVGAVNTVVLAGGRATGFNSDMDGFVNALLARGVNLAGQRAVLFGAGGAAGAVVCGLLAGGIEGITVGTRDGAKAAAFAATFSHNKIVAGCDWNGPAFTAALGGGDLLINCTPLGMHPHTGDSPPLDWAAVKSGAVACDLIYNPAMSKFLLEAAATGHKVVGGAGMLVEQAAIAFSLWTGVEAPRAAMYQAMAEYLA